MSNSYEKQDVEYAFRVLELALRTKGCLESEIIDPSRFGAKIEIVDTSETIIFSDSYFLNRENAVLVASFNVGVAFGASAIALDNLFEAIRGQRNAASNDPADVLWCLAYAVRNAFAHGIANPVWRVRKRYCKTLTVELYGARLEVDLRELNGKEFCYEHIGGLGNWWRIKERAFELLEV